MKKLSFCCLFFIVWLISTLLNADTIYLENGKILEGEIISETVCDITLKMKYGEVTLAKNNIKKIEKKPFNPDEEPENKTEENSESQSQEKPEKEKPQKKIKIFTVDDFLELEKKFENHEKLDVEEKLKLVIDWKNNYQGKSVIIKGKVAVIGEDKKLVNTDDGEKTLTILKIKIEYFDLSLSAIPENRKRVWTSNSWSDEDTSKRYYKLEGCKSDILPHSVGDTVYLSARFPKYEKIESIYFYRSAIISFLKSICIADLPSENVEEVQQDKQSDGCDYCLGVGERTCSSCKGAGKRRCSGCNSRGEVRCPKCDGNGWVQLFPSGTATCGKCYGSGKLGCRNCKGTGVVVCTSCDGSGKKRCPMCKGTGEKK
ncbi:MAG: hypothetical protein ABIH42_03230 [Planctomycetota bacterium]